MPQHHGNKTALVVVLFEVYYIYMPKRVPGMCTSGRCFPAAQQRNAAWLSSALIRLSLCFCRCISRNTTHLCSLIYIICNCIQAKGLGAFIVIINTRFFRRAATLRHQLCICYSESSSFPWLSAQVKPYRLQSIWCSDLTNDRSLLDAPYLGTTSS